MRFCWIALAVIWCLLASTVSSSGSEPVLVEQELRVQKEALPWFDLAVSPLHRRDFKISGAASCSAAACHGGPRPSVIQADAVRGSEYTLWHAHDPHARSWRTMCSEESVEMMERLQIIRRGEIVDRAGFDNCLACHNSTQSDLDARQTTFQAEGVGCAACHGPSEIWKPMHFQADWTPSHQHGLGYIDNSNLLIRARMCASCHVGDRDRDMNHDIIAAGHPVLRYEFATFSSRLPKHWRERDKGQHFEAQSWLAGQVAGLDAFLTLLEARATKSTVVSQWPELAVSDCRGCHQNLAVPDLSAPPSQTASLLTSVRFGVQRLLRSRRELGESTSLDTELEAALQQVNNSLTSQAIPDRAEVVDAAKVARVALANWIRSDSSPSPEGQLLAGFSAARLRQLAKKQASTGDMNAWEEAVEVYLAGVIAQPHSSLSDASGTIPIPLSTTALERAATLRSVLLEGMDNRNRNEALQAFETHWLQSDR